MRYKLIAICLAIALDILTGLIGAFASGTYDSTKMRAGLFHKLGEVLAWLLCFACDIFLPRFDISIPFSIVNAVSIYIFLMEIGSITENIGVINPDIGSFLSGVFEKLKNETDKR